jgi:ankyrin repeat protein
MSEAPPGASALVASVAAAAAAAPAAVPARATAEQAQAPPAAAAAAARAERIPPVLYDAVRMGDFERLAEYLSKGGAVHESDSRGMTLLHHACYIRNATATQRALDLLLRSERIDLEAQDGDGWTPLHAACSTGNVAAVSALLAAGVNVNARDQAKRTPLHVAVSRCIEGSIEVVSKLIASGSSLTARNVGNATPVDAARANGATPEMLAALGAA